MQILEREQIWLTQKSPELQSLKSQKAYTINRKLLPVAPPDDILRSYEVKQSVIAINLHYLQRYYL